MLKNIINTFITRVAASAANLIIAIIISNIFGAAIKGEQGLILATITIITLVAALIGAGSIVYLIPRMSISSLLIPSYLWNLLICIVVFILLKVTSILPDGLVMPTCLLAFIQSISMVHSGALLGIEKIKESNYANLTNTLFVLCALLFNIFILKTGNIFAYIYALYIGYLAGFLLSTLFVFRSRSLFYSALTEKTKSVISATRELFRFGLLNQMDVLTQMLSFRLSYYAISYYMSKSAVGIYSNAISIVESIWLISRSISMVQNARIVNSNDLNYSVRITLQLLKVSFLLVFVVVVILQFVPASFYRFLFGNEFGEVRMVILTVSPGILFFCISFILSGLFAGTGNYRYNTIASVAGLIVTLPLVVILIPRLGLTGAGITASISYCSHTAVKLSFFIRKFPVTARELRITKTDFQLFFNYLKAEK